MIMEQRIFTVDLKLAMIVPDHLSSVDETLAKTIINEYFMQDDWFIDWQVIEVIDKSVKFKTIDSFTYYEGEAFEDTEDAEKKSVRKLISFPQIEQCSTVR